MKDLISSVKQEEEVDVLFLVTHMGVFKQVDLANQEMSKDVDYILGTIPMKEFGNLFRGNMLKFPNPEPSVLSLEN